LSCQCVATWLAWREQIDFIEQARLKRIEQAPGAGPNATVRMLASIVDVGMETADTQAGNARVRRGA